MDLLLSVKSFQMKPTRTTIIKLFNKIATVADNEKRYRSQNVNGGGGEPVAVVAAGGESGGKLSGDQFPATVWSQNFETGPGGVGVSQK
jgi:hypothetical protein